jgi:hypothetical protein
MAHFLFTRSYNRFDLACILSAWLLTPNTWGGALEFASIIIGGAIVSGFFEAYFETE